jgi:hypothetical protein
MSPEYAVFLGLDVGKGEAPLMNTPERKRLSHEQIESLVPSAGSITRMLATTDPASKEEAYRQLGLALTYHPRAEGR